MATFFERSLKGRCSHCDRPMMLRKDPDGDLVVWGHEPLDATGYGPERPLCLGSWNPPKVDDD